MKLTTKDTLFVAWGEHEGSKRYSVCTWTGKHFTVNDMMFLVLINSSSKKVYTLSCDFLKGKVQNLSNISSSKEIEADI